MLNRKLAGLGLGLLAGAAIVLSATAAMAQDRLTVWTDVVRQSQIEAYKALHPEVTIDVQTVAPEEVVSKLQVLMRAKGAIPDLIWMADSNFASRLSTRLSNYLMDISDLIPQATKDNFYNNANRPCTINGKLVCLRNDITPNVIWYNAPLLQDLGKTVPATWEEFEQLSADVAALNQGYVMGSSSYPYTLWVMMMSAGCDMAVPVDGKEDTLKIDLSTEQCLRPARMIDNMIANGTLIPEEPPSPAFVQKAQANKLVMLVAPTWYGEFVVKASYAFAPKQTGIAIPPKWADQTEPMTWSMGGGAWGIWKDTQVRDAALDMLLWLDTSNENAAAAVTMAAYEPASQAWGKGINESGYYANEDPFGTLVESAGYAHPGYSSLRISVDQAISKTFTPILLSGGKLVDALPGIQQELINQAQLNGYTVE
ncbi:ABC transporter substrate-binding protein [Devosia epidermidihirudinis]|nr:extracellular solute-binding protein [Devosia epidermidihirudinis]